MVKIVNPVTCYILDDDDVKLGDALISIPLTRVDEVSSISL